MVRKTTKTPARTSAKAQAAQAAKTKARKAPAAKPAAKAVKAAATTAAGRRSAKRLPQGHNPEVVELGMELENLLTRFIKLTEVDQTLTAAEKRRLIGAGAKNYGFIDQAFDIARDNPQALPREMFLSDMWDNLIVFEQARQVTAVLEQFLIVSKEYMAILSNRCYHDALFIYDNLKMQAKNREPWAVPLYEMLLPFFKKRRGKVEGEPTAREVVRDVRSLLRGRADGEILVKGRRSRVSGGKREVVDAIRRGRMAARESETEELE